MARRRADRRDLNVDVSPEILELGLSELRLAVAQIVFTAGELDGVRTCGCVSRGRPRLGRTAAASCRVAP